MTETSGIMGYLEDTLMAPLHLSRSTPGRLVLVFALIVSTLASAFGGITPVAATGQGARIDPVLQQRMVANPAERLPVIVEMEHATTPEAGANSRLAQQAFNLLDLKGRAHAALSLTTGAAGVADAAAITALSLTPGVANVHFDAPVRAHDRDGGTSANNLATAYPRAVNADRVWGTGHTGKGVTVAVLDSGITPDMDLVQPTNRILAAVNFADALGSNADPGGHGTHVAGTIAGNGRRSGGEFIGIAPGANLVDVRVLDENGNGRESAVILGIQWALAHQVQYNIRVLNLSLGRQAPVSYRTDPLSAAVEMAWLRGLVVVAAAGNTGGAPDLPGADPYVITVGATDDRQTTTIGDDVVAWFSSFGTPAYSTAKPDLVAPGRRIVSIRAPGSSLDRLLPDHIVTARNGATYFRLTGTSMATAVISGVAALVLERQPKLTPDQVKSVLMGTTRRFGQSSGTTPNPAAIGAGLADAYAASDRGPDGRANHGHRPSDSSARSLYPALYGQPLTWINPTADGIPWSSLTWNNIVWDNVAWDNIVWDNVAWDNIVWDNIIWDNLVWDNLVWDNLVWDNLVWDNLVWDSQTLD